MEDIRHSQLVLISKRVEKANDTINQILTKLNWTREELKQWQSERKKLQSCPFNKRHVVPESSMKEHYRQCLLKSRGIHDTKKKRSTTLGSSLYFYAKWPSIISFTTPEQVDPCLKSQNIIDTQLIPQQQQQQKYYIKELEPLPSILEKCQAYDQVIQTCHQLRRRHYNNNDDEKRTKINLEMDRLVYEKKRIADKLRRTTDQQKKRKHIKMKMKTPTEIQRELIQAYMQEYNNK